MSTGALCQTEDGSVVVYSSDRSSRSDGSDRWDRARSNDRTIRTARTNYTGASDGLPDAAAGLQRDRAYPAPPLSVPARGPHHGARAGQADRRDQERLAERALPVPPAGRSAGAASHDPYRGHRAGGSDPDPVEAGEPREAAVLHGHR